MRVNGVKSISPEEIYDCIGIGFGPSNIALAIALQEQNSLARVRFLEGRSETDWQPDMLLPGSDIQHNPLRDFVTPRNPRSPFGFLSYLHDQGRLLDFLRLEAPFPPRREYASYVKWVAAKFSHAVDYNASVTGIDLIDGPLRKPVYIIRCGSGKIYMANTISFGVGRSQNIPVQYQPYISARVIHSDNYLSTVKNWARDRSIGRIAVVGASQSAVEIILDLHSRLPEVAIACVSRGFGFKLKDVSPFTEKIYSPEFIDYFYSASEHSQSEMTRELWRSNYGAADHDVIASLDFLLYEQKVAGTNRVLLFDNQITESVEPLKGSGFELKLHDRHSEEPRVLQVDTIILATGYRNFGSSPDQERYHPLLRSLAPRFQYRSDGGLAISRDFRVLNEERYGELPPLFVNGLCESTHGFGDAGSFSLLATRSELIASSIGEHLCHNQFAITPEARLPRLAAGE
ncbi:SidA/IucD/PvdA family monooxygenase [Agrobacterium sp. a22-2]|uniref:SidA/IucD/PvdA family monooxygenase n=1 Tax=Agrobacterium sp. a22-2 TaxID=2283840 RepID=UPI001445B3C5|nr:SidA/IucD/PvdA family monooxygenase [Agrobacterium sp. a22-2]NKN39010.1 SidA/IucD/PvdA family monooxygenase [Agrobacterium sp. a22-2]